MKLSHAVKKKHAHYYFRHDCHLLCSMAHRLFWAKLRLIWRYQKLCRLVSSLKAICMLLNETMSGAFPQTPLDEIEPCSQEKTRSRLLQTRWSLVVICILWRYQKLSRLVYSFKAINIVAIMRNSSISCSIKNEVALFSQIMFSFNKKMQKRIIKTLSKVVVKMIHNKLCNIDVNKNEQTPVGELFKLNHTYSCLKEINY